LNFTFVGNEKRSSATQRIGLFANLSPVFASALAFGFRLPGLGFFRRFSNSFSVRPLPACPSWTFPVIIFVSNDGSLSSFQTTAAQEKKFGFSIHCHGQSL
jgi:hypothetical protein